MSTTDKTREKGGITVSLLGREFRVACPEGEERQLLTAVDYLNRKLKEVREASKVASNDRIALMAALNIAHECLSNSGKGSAGGADAAAIRRRIAVLEETVDAALAADQENLF
ncbi:MAG TPA: cell division protein ZapA [Usitatibacter sp.]|jgi:cell division protein ZapA|nr:cell division protein ZapA [Usitatibacter sp.]